MGFTILRTFAQPVTSAGIHWQELIMTEMDAEIKVKTWTMITTESATAMNPAPGGSAHHHLRELTFVPKAHHRSCPS